MENLKYKLLKDDYIEYNGKKFYRIQALKDFNDIKKGEFVILTLGFAMRLPKGFEVDIVPSSSTFKITGLLQVNSMGIIDNSYSGNEDYWKAPVLATRDVKINKGDRLFQFRIFENMKEIEIVQVDELDKTNRGGFGSTGLN